MSRADIPTYPHSAVTRQDFDNLRTDLRDHEQRDREDFAAMRAAIDKINMDIAEWVGAMKLLKTFAVVGIPSMLTAAGAALVNVIRHW